MRESYGTPQFFVWRYLPKMVEVLCDRFENSKRCAAYWFPPASEHGPDRYQSPLHRRDGAFPQTPSVCVSALTRQISQAPQTRDIHGERVFRGSGKFQNQPFWRRIAKERPHKSTACDGCGWSPNPPVEAARVFRLGNCEPARQYAKRCSHSVYAKLEPGRAINSSGRSNLNRKCGIMSLLS